MWLSIILSWVSPIYVDVLIVKEIIERLKKNYDINK